MASNERVEAFIALGANLGDRAANLREALRLLDKAPGVRVLRVSSFLENASVGGPPGAPPFLNAAAAIQTTLAPRDLLDLLLAIESQMGRVRGEKNDPRLIDLDLLLYGDAVIASSALTIPHPLMHLRRFVLEPLAEIAPEVMHPVLEMSMRELLFKCQRENV
jgi:2-amino-4-hydroxy-6-hydroxymethyldihydropteridine diphosphokinase